MDREALEEALNAAYFKHKGIYFESDHMSREFIDDIENMEIRDDDVFLVTYPKSGTIWTQQILSLIFNEGHRNGTEQMENMDRVPWIEYEYKYKDNRSRPSPRLFTSHLPYYLMPRDLKYRMGKILYVCRNPKDVLVSFYHFTRMIPYLKLSMDWETYLEVFISGRGTVWTQLILSLIFNEGHRNGTEQIDNIDRVPWLEYNINNIDFNSRPSPRLFSTHLPYYLMPRDLKYRMGKILYVCRNPKDVMVSYYHFFRMISYIKYTMDWETFFEIFLSGRVYGGSWFDHVRGWYTHKEDFNIMFLTYEEMKKDLRSTVKKICKFVGVNLDEKAIDTVVERATFKNMKCDPLANYESIPNEILDKAKGSFLRKGIVGDWKNIMMVAQSERIDQIYKEKMGDLPINFLWDLDEESAP